MGDIKGAKISTPLGGANPHRHFIGIPHTLTFVALNEVITKSSYAKAFQLESKPLSSWNSYNNMIREELDVSGYDKRIERTFLSFGKF